VHEAAGLCGWPEPARLRPPPPSDYLTEPWASPPWRLISARRWLKCL